MIKKIVFIVDYWYPNLSAGSICIKKIVEQMKKDYPYYEIIVMSISGDKTIEKYVRTKDGYLVVNLVMNKLKRRQLLENSIRNKKGLSKKICVLSLNIHKLRYICLSIYHKCSVNKDLINIYFNELEAINDIDILVPVCFPFESILASMKYKFKHNVKIIPILYDLFSESNTLHWFRFNKKMKYKNNLHLEKEMFEVSDKILYIENWKNHVQKNFDNYKMKSKLVGLPLIVPHLKTSKTQNENVIKVLFSGSVNSVDRSPFYTCKLIEEILSRTDRYKFIFHVIGNDISPIIELNRKFPSNVIYALNVDLETANAEKDNDNVFLSIGNENSVQLPSKIFDYMSYGKPIVHLYKKENDVVLNVLKKYRLSLCIYESDSVFNQNVKDFINFLDKNGNENEKFNIIKAGFFDNCPDAIIKELIN